MIDHFEIFYRGFNEPSGLALSSALCASLPQSGSMPVQDCRQLDEAAKEGPKADDLGHDVTVCNRDFPVLYFPWKYCKSLL